MRTSFSLSPRHLLASVLADTLMNVVRHSVATAFASSVLPVPGGPYSSTPRQGLRMPEKKAGQMRGSTTASCSSALAPSRPAMSPQRTLGARSRISPSIWATSSRSGPA